MKRVLLILATVLLVFAAVGAATQVGGAQAEPAGVPVSAACIETPLDKSGSVDAHCRDWMYQVYCQFNQMSQGYLPESVEPWCKQNATLEQGAKPEVPRCDLALAGQQGDVAERCRDFLAATQCFNGGSSQADMQEFCAKDAIKAGPDPRPIKCTAATAHERSPEGNRCWQKLEKEWCPGFEKYGNTGVDEQNKFCEEVAAGKKPPSVDAKCDTALAEQDTDAGHACRDQLYTTQCQTLNKLPPEVETFCHAVSDERKKAKEAEEKKQAEEKPPPEEKKDKGPPTKTGAPGVQLGREPICDHRQELDPQLKRACDLTGSAMHQFPFANYGIDNNISIELTGDDSVLGDAPILSLFQWVIVGIWQALIWLVKMALLLLQWAFAIDPLESAGNKIAATVRGFFDLIGPEWRLTALAVLGVWGAWNGLVRRQFVQTLSGLLLSMLLMVVAMWIVYDPIGTVGKVAHYANESSSVMLSATSSGQLENPQEGIAQSQHTLFDQLVVGPWCALQFGSQGKCNEPTNDPKVSRRELWLSLPANSTAREVLYVATKEGTEKAEEVKETSGFESFMRAVGDGLCMYTAGLSGTCPENEEDLWKTDSEINARDHPEQAKQFEEAKKKAMELVKQDPSAVVLQGSEGTFTRAGLLAVILVGIVGAVAFLLAIGVRLVVAGVIVLLLILLAPVMLIVAAFGEEGRRRFITWVRMLLGAALAKLVYSVLLGLVLAVVAILVQISGDEQDWLGGWLLVSAFFWIAVLQMNRVLALLAPDPASEQGNGMAAGAAFWMAPRMIGGMFRSARRGAMFVPRQVAPRALRAARRQRGYAREGTENAVRKFADKELEMRATAASLRDKREQGNRAQDVIDRSAAVRGRVARLDRQLERKLPPGRRAQLEAERAKAQRYLTKQEPQERWARWQLQSHNQQSEGEGIGGVRARREQRRRDISRWRDNADSWSSESNRRWAGITDSEYKRAEGAATLGNNKPMDDLRRRAEGALRRDQELFTRADREAPLSRQAREGGRREWGDARDGMVPRRPKDREGAEFATRRRDERRAARRRGRDNLRKRRI